MKLLIVDDARPLRERLVDMLSHITGLDILAQAATVAEALSAIRDLKPDLAILDLQLPDGNGIQVLREAKRIVPQMKVIVFTNHPEAQYQQRCDELGADFFLNKFTDSNLLVRIAETLTLKESPDDCPDERQ